MSRPIRLADAAKHYKAETHQLAAWNWLEGQIPLDVYKEFADLYRAAPVSKPTEDPWLPPALKIIKEFEGLKLEAYLCPAGVWTIGYGTTLIEGRAVRPGEMISQLKADELLRGQVTKIFAPAVFALLPQAVKLPPNQIAALISWAYNVGIGAVESSTLRKRLLAGEPALKVIEEELPKWNKGDGKVLLGLQRRREAEVALAKGGTSSPAFNPKSPFSYRVTPNIRYGEFALDQEARRFDAQHQCDTAVELAQFLEKVRKQFGNKPVRITSGYRPAAINRSVGGASGSEHLYGSAGVGAVDFFIEGADILAVERWCDANWPYSLGYGAKKGFVHLGIRRGRPRVRWDY